MKRFELAFVLFGLLSSVSWAANRCGGGEGGPHPLADFTSSFKADFKVLSTAGDLEEFLFINKSDMLIYRTSEKNIYKMENFESSYKITSSSLPLGRLVHPSERYLVAEGAPWVFDLKNGVWYNYQTDARPFVHAMWNGDYLYDVSQRIDGAGSQFISVYQYKVGSSQSQKICATLESPPGHHLMMAEGHQYPHLYFYRTEKAGAGMKITFFEMNVGLFCHLDPVDKYTREIAGPVKSVHVFKSLGSLAVEVDHPFKNLLWDSTDGCRYFNIERLKPLVLNYDKPIIATWSPNAGMSLIYLDAKKQAKVKDLVDGGSPISELLQRDVWMANDGKRIFLSPRFPYDESRWLLRMTLEN